MRSEKGIALVTALGLLLVMSVLVLGTFWTTQLELWTTRNDTTSVQAFYVAEAGLQKYKAALFNQHIWQEREFGGGSPTRSASCYSSFADGIDWNRDGSIDQGESFTDGKMTLATDEPVPDANGNPLGYATVELYQINPRTYTLVSKGTSKGAKATVQAVFFLETVSPLNTAIFVKEILMGSTIRGGLYATGGPRGTPAVEAMVFFQSLLNRYDLSGYAPLAQAVSPTRVGADDLCATLRVFGKVYTGRGVQIGEPTNRFKGIYVREEVSRGSRSQAIYTEEQGSFDLSDPPPFPTLDATLDGAGGCGWNLSWRECLLKEAEFGPGGLWVENTAEGPTIHWPLMSQPADRDGCEEALSSGVLSLGSNSEEVDCSYTIIGYGTKGGFKYTPGAPGTPAILEVYGTVVLDGYDLGISGDVRYRAQTGGAKNASLVVLKKGLNDGTFGGTEVAVKGNLLPDPTFGTFPEHVLGLVVEGDFTQGQYQDPQTNTRTRSYMAAVVYVGGKFTMKKTFVDMRDGPVLVGSAIARGLNMYPNSEVIFVNTAGNAPWALKAIDEYAKRFAFHTFSYERR